jgi:TRAP-type C4-dicarboxylate transport system substrate-binding protein
MGSRLQNRRRALMALGLLVPGISFMTSARAQAKIELRMGHGNPVDTPVDLGVKRLAELINERSGGTIMLRTYAQSLGNENQLIEGLRRTWRPVLAPCFRCRMSSAYSICSGTSITCRR